MVSTVPHLSNCSEDSKVRFDLLVGCLVSCSTVTNLIPTPAQRHWISHNTMDRGTGSRRVTRSKARMWCENNRDSVCGFCRLHRSLAFIFGYFFDFTSGIFPGESNYCPWHTVGLRLILFAWPMAWRDFQICPWEWFLFQHVQKEPNGTEFNRAKTTVREFTRIKLRPRTLPRSTRTDVCNKWLEGMAKGGTVQGYFLQKLQGLLKCVLA